MQHEIHRVTAFERVGPFTLEIRFEDGTTRTIDFEPVLAGEVYGPLSDPKVFGRVELDREAHTLVWPNGADFDPAMLYDWQRYGPELAKMAKTWSVPVR